MVEHSPQILACEEKATTTTTTTTTKIQSLTYCLASMYTTHSQLIALVKEPVLVIDQSGERGWGWGGGRERKKKNAESESNPRSRLRETRADEGRAEKLRTTGDPGQDSLSPAEWRRPTYLLSGLVFLLDLFSALSLDRDSP